MASCTISRSQYYYMMRIEPNPIDLQVLRARTETAEMQDSQLVRALGSETGCGNLWMIIQLNEDNDPNNRRAIYNIFVKAAEDLELKEQAER